MHGAEQITGNFRRNRDTEQQHRPEFHALRHVVLVLRELVLVTATGEQWISQAADAEGGHSAQQPAAPEQNNGERLAPHLGGRRHQDHARGEGEHGRHGREQEEDQRACRGVLFHRRPRPIDGLVDEGLERRRQDDQANQHRRGADCKPEPDGAPIGRQFAHHTKLEPQAGPKFRGDSPRPGPRHLRIRCVRPRLSLPASARSS